MRRLLLAGLALYKRCVSPLLPVACRYTPTCSEYAAEAVARHGALAGFALAAWRLMRCHPFGGRGLDPVPAQLPWSCSSRVHKCEFAHPHRGERAARDQHSSAATAAQIGILP